MNKKATAGIVAGVLACSLTAGGLSLINADAEVVGSNAQEWGTMSTTVKYAADGFVDIGGGGWGSRVWYKDKVKIDGLVVDMNVIGYHGHIQNVGSGFGGFWFANDENGYLNGDGGVPVAFTHWQEMNGWGANRFAISANHSTAASGDQLVSPVEDFSKKGFGINATTIEEYNPETSQFLTQIKDIHYTISFSSHNEDLYKVRVSIAASDDAWWIEGGNPAHYLNQGTTDDGDPYCEVYMQKSTLSTVVDENGYSLICFSDMPMSETGHMSVRIEDDNIRAYKTDSVAPAEAKVTAYENAEVTDDASFTAAMEKREAALAAVSSLKAREKAELTERITAVDEGYKTNETVQTSVTGLVQDKIDEARNAFGAIFADESTLTEASIGAANDKVKAAKREYADKKAMLSDDNAATLEDGIGNIEYYSQKMSVLEWIVGYEKAIEDLDVTADTIGADIAAVKAVKAAFVGSDTETALNGLADADKTAYATRITAADSALASKEDDAAEAVKTAYVVAFEEMLEDLSSYSKIEAAFEQKGVLESSITLTTDDGELFTRYTAGVEKLYTALETFVSDAITSVSTALDGKFETLASFSDVRSDYNDITLELLGEDRAATATITSAYDALTEKLKANIWYDFAQTNLSKVERNEKGIYFEQTPEFPSRINYNKKLDLTEGTEVVVELTQMAYYNGDLTAGGASKGANNLSINFSNAPNSYKSMSQGINIIIWLFEVESNVQIMSPTDNVMANGTLATPLNGGKLTITVKHGVYEDFVAEESYPAYIITLNEVEIVLSDDIAAANGLSVNDEVYFSMGSFADYKADPNCFTLVSVDDAQFAAKSDKPDPDPDPDPKPTPDPKPDDNNNVGLIVGLSVAGGVIVLAGVAVAVVFVLKKKKSAAGGVNDENTENKQDEE